MVPLAPIIISTILQLLHYSSAIRTRNKAVALSSDTSGSIPDFDTSGGGVLVINITAISISTTQLHTNNYYYDGCGKHINILLTIKFLFQSTI